MKNTKIFMLALLCPAFFASAQDMSTEVVVDRTIPTSLPEAAPLKNVQPTLVEQDAQVVSLPQSDFGLRADFTPVTSSLLPAPFTGIDEPTKYKGFVWLGYLPVYNLGAAAGYRLVDTRHTKLGIAADFIGNSYSNRFSDSKVDQNTFKGKLYGSHSLKNGLTFTALYDGGATWLHTPGRFNLMMSEPQEILYEQRISQHYAALKMKNTTERLFYSVSADYRCIGLKNQVSGLFLVPNEGIWHVDGELRTLKKGFGFGMGASADFVNICNSYSYTFITLDPSLLYKKGNLTLDLGLRLNLIFGSNEFPLHVAPRAKALWRLAPMVAVYGRALGGKSLNTFYNVMRYSPFALVDDANQLTQTNIDFRVGVRIGNFAGVSADIFAGYVNAESFLPAADENNYAFYRLSPQNVSGMHVGMKIEYTLSDRLETDAEFILGPNDVESFTYFDQASRTMRLTATWKPVDKLKIGASWNVRGGRHYASYKGNTGMGAISDLDFNAAYNVAPNFSVFLKLDNLFDRRPLLLPGLAKPGFKGLVGLDFSF